MRQSVKIILPLPPKVLQPNAVHATFRGRMMKASATKRYRRLACEAVQEEQIDSAPWDYVEVETEFFFKDKRRRDPDNALASLKAAFDGITDSGLVEDDDWQHMKRMPPEQNIDRENPRVEITITDKATYWR